MNDFRYDKTNRSLIPARPGYYWAKWRIASDGTHEGDELTPSNKWEIVQVNDNNVDDPKDDEYLSVSVPGVRETQWRDCFVWGPLVAPIAEYGKLYPAVVTPISERVVAFISEHDPFGDRFSAHDLERIEGRARAPLSSTK